MNVRRPHAATESGCMGTFGEYWYGERGSSVATLRKITSDRYSPGE